MNIWVKKIAEPFDRAKRVTAETKRPDPGVLLEPRQQIHPLRAGPGRRRELQRLRGEPGRRAGRAGQRRAEGAQPDRGEGRARGHLRRPAPQRRPDLRRAQRSRCRVARPLRGEDLDRRAQAAAEEHATRSPAGCSTAPASCAWPRARPTTATPRSSRVTDDRLRAGLSAAACSRPATRCSSTPTTRASTWRRTAASPT